MFGAPGAGITTGVRRLEKKYPRAEPIAPATRHDSFNRAASVVTHRNGGSAALQESAFA